MTTGAAPATHRLLRRLRNAPKIIGGTAVGCTCGWMTIGGSMPALLRAHAAHAAAPPPDEPVE